MDLSTLPPDIRSYFAEIAERLWTSHASVMVGAGLSKNAINTINPSKRPPDWVQLGDLFYEKLHSQPADEHVKYASLLKLAEEFEAAFGRSTLEHFVQKNIADNEYEPSDIHRKLMELPWTDVFTTNYDTLLERSCKDVLFRRYDVVLNQNDLIYSNKPRIVKLHGSFPSERPFILTEEDYRVYPQKYAPFVNTVQQSLLENTLCLIGFSGDDPNFLQWIGWINDNIGKSNASKIYLVGVLNVSESQKKLLNNKNIIPVDLSTCLEIEGNHKKGLELFINYLAGQGNKGKNLDWPLSIDLKTFHPSEGEDIQSLIKEWTTCRSKYPNWVILPQEQRDRLWLFTEDHSYNEVVFERLQPFEELDYIYELNWRLEKCLFPVWNNMVPYFQKILNRYNLFPKEITAKREINIDQYTAKVNWNHHKKQWIELSLSLLRFYREENFEKEWVDTRDIITLLKQHLTQEQRAQFHYELILNSIFQMQHADAKNLLDEWPQNNASLFWEAKRAMLLTEFGRLKEAVDILEFVLTEIRKKLNLSPIEEDYSWVSQESYVMFMLGMANKNIRRGNSDNNGQGTDKSEEFDERWNDLLQYKCDPWGELKHFETMLRQPYIPKKTISINYEFEIGRSTRTHSLGRTSDDFINAYTFLRYLDELALPISLSAVNINSKTIDGVLERIITFSPKWGIAILNRHRNKDAVKVVFDRNYLKNRPINIINDYVKAYLNSFKTMLPECDSNDIAKAFTNKVPIILSRLCTKCNDELRIDIFSTYQMLCKQGIHLPEIDRLLKNLIDSSSKEILTQAVEILLDTPILNWDSYDAKYTFREPFELLSTIKINGNLKITSELLEILFQKANENTGIRINAIKRLRFLYDNKQLNEGQIQRLFDIIWGKVDKNGFPQNTNYCHFVFLKWPQPDNINAEELFRKYIEANNFHIQELQTTEGISMTEGEDRYATELLGGSQTINNVDGVKWTNSELSSILTKCEQWWNLDKHYLSEERYEHDGFGESIRGDFQARFKKLANIISRVWGYHQQNLPLAIRKRIVAIIKNMEEHHVPILKAKVVFGLYDGGYKAYLIEVQRALISKERNVMLDALDSIILAIHSSPYIKEKGFLDQLVKILCVPLKWQITELMSDIFYLIKDLEEHSDVNLVGIKKDILSSLQYVLDIDIHNDKIPLEEYLKLKQKAISLAGTLYRKEETASTNIPQVLLNWKAVADDENEFGDIRNRW